jgi:hypothetical protein
VVSVTGTGAGTFANKNVAEGKAVAVTGFSLTGADAVNYTIVQPTGLTANITPALLTISGITAAEKTYDGTRVASVSTARVVKAGLMAGDLVTVSATGQFASKDVGDGKEVNLSSSYGGADLGNYSITGQSSTTANIQAADLQVMGVRATNKVYDGNVSAPLTGAAVVAGFGADAVRVTGTGSGTFANKNVADGKAVMVTGLSLTGADAVNYKIIQPRGLTASITPAPLLVTANNATKTYDGQPFTGGNGVSYNGFVNNETAAELGGALTYIGTSQGAINVANYVITPSGLNSTNYALAYADGVLTINPAQVVIAPVPSPNPTPAPTPTQTPTSSSTQVSSTEVASASSGEAETQKVVLENPVLASNARLSFRVPAINSVKLPDTSDKGFFPITVVQANESTTSAVAFEKGVETVSLRTAAKPLVRQEPDKVVFSTKLTEFVVTSASGKTVTFTGGLVNGRLVIVAPSDDSKQLAKDEMNVVLAAAVVALGKETPIVMANLEGVVFDLR